MSGFSGGALPGPADAGGREGVDGVPGHPIFSRLLDQDRTLKVIPWLTPLLFWKARPRSRSDSGERVGEHGDPGRIGPSSFETRIFRGASARPGRLLGRRGDYEDGGQ